MLIRIAWERLAALMDRWCGRAPIPRVAKAISRPHTEAETPLAVAIEEIMDKKTTYIIAAIAAIYVLLNMRVIVPSGNHESHGAFILNRITGSVELCYPAGCRELRKASQQQQ